MGDRAMIISADMAVAIPIAMLSMAMLAYGMSGAQSYYLAYARSSYLQIRYYSISQQMLIILNSVDENRSTYLGTVQSMGKFYNVSASIMNLSGYPCCAKAFCRIVQVNGTTMILVLR